jgi:hypothetical protein
MLSFVLAPAVADAHAHLIAVVGRRMFDRHHRWVGRIASAELFAAFARHGYAPEQTIALKNQEQLFSLSR